VHGSGSGILPSEARYLKGSNVIGFGYVRGSWVSCLQNERISMRQIWRERDDKPEVGYDKGTFGNEISLLDMVFHSAVGHT
jgi:hypothetical protein